MDKVLHAVGAVLPVEPQGPAVVGAGIGIALAELQNLFVRLFRISYIAGFFQSRVIQFFYEKLPLDRPCVLISDAIIDAKQREINGYTCEKLCRNCGFLIDGKKEIEYEKIQPKRKKVIFRGAQ